jgi:hypothetical protein
MLYKNDEIFDLKMHPEEIKKIETHFHNKFPVRMVYPPERIQKSRLPHNRLPDKPASLSFKLRSVVKTDKGTEVWRYAENVIVGDHGTKKFMPANFVFEGKRELKRNDIELIFFLLRKCEHCFGGDNNTGKVMFMFEDLVTEAEKRAEKKELESKIDLLLYNKEYGLPEEKLRQVAMAYGVSNVDGMTLPQVKNTLNDKIHGTKDGHVRFFDMVNAEEEIKTRMTIQKVIDQGILIHNEKDRAWQWKTPQGVEKVAGGKVAPNKTPMEALYDLYQGDESFRDDMQAVLLTKNPKAGKKKEEVPTE